MNKTRRVLVVELINEEGSKEYWKLQFVPQNNNYDLTARVAVEQLNHSIFTNKVLRNHVWKINNSYLLNFDDYFYGRRLTASKDAHTVDWKSLKPFIQKALEDGVDYAALRGVE